MLNKNQLKKILSSENIISENEFEKISKEAKQEGKNIEKYFIDKKIITSNSLYKNASRYYKLPFINLKIQKIRKDVLLSIPEKISTIHQLVAFDSNADRIKIATTNPDNIEIFEFIKKSTGLEPKIYITTPEDLRITLKKYYDTLKGDLTQINFDLFNRDKHKGEEEKKLEKIAEDLPVVRIVDTILEYAIHEEASDIHIEPEEKDLMVRYRIDGMLHDIMTLPKDTQLGIIARIKILANLKVDEHRMPQDGRFKIANEKYKISFRVSIISTIDGEKIVLRLLNERAQIMSLEQLGLQPSSLKILKRNIKSPNGMILSTGPTGSGKTTTLYTILNQLNKPEVNISTIEDPIEYRIERVNQSQINTKIGYTFAIGLRALLRQDPDIIMVGEIRDEETAEIAVHSAMTGHLVLSTLHTNDTITTLPRLVDMGIPSFLIAATTNLIIAQRLVRKICPHCIQSFNLDSETIKEIKEQINLPKVLKTMEDEKIIIHPDEGLKTLLFYRGKGCKQCNNTGYKGRIGIYETLEITSEISNLILKKASSEEIKKQADKQGMLTMLEDGFIKAKNGITTLEEILRVTKD